MTILLAGGAGYIGSHTAVELLNSGYDVAVVDNLSNSSSIAITRCEEITGKKITFYESDVADKASLRKIFDEVKPSGVIHFAGFKSVSESVSKPLMYYRNNLDSTLSLLEVMGEFGVNHFIFSSSATVYGMEVEIPCIETASTGGCTNPYGWTKYMIEQIARDVAVSVPDFSVIILRYFNPVGAHGSGLIGEDPSDIPNNLMPYITQVAAGKLKCLNIFGNDYPTHDGTGVRDYIHVVDLAKGHVAALEYSLANPGIEVFNLGTGHGTTVLDLVNAFMASTGVNVPYKIAPRRPGDIAECWADPSKAEKMLGWRAEKDIGDMCRDAWRWQSNNPNGYE